MSPTSHMSAIDIAHMLQTLNCHRHIFTQHLHPFAKAFVLLCFLSSPIDNSRDTPSPVKSFLRCPIAIAVESCCLKVCTMHPVCFNIGHQIFVFSNREVAFAFKFHLSSNRPPTGKGKYLLPLP